MAADPEKVYALKYQVTKNGEPINTGEFAGMDYDDVLKVEKVVMDGLQSLGKEKSDEKKRGRKS